MVKEKCYCSFCKNERVYIKKRHIGFKDVAFAAFAASLLTFAFWQKLDPRLMVFFVGFCVLGETLVRIRHRLSLICPYCSFDPILYLRDPQKMSLQVTKYMQERRIKSDYFLSAKKLDKLAKIKKVQEVEKEAAAEA